MNPLPAGSVPTGSETSPRVRERFRRFSGATASAMGSPWAFITACSAVVVWALLGPRFRFSDTWQLVINTGTTIITFLMVFLIQTTQNRDARAIQLKLDELIRGNSLTRNQLIDLEECDETELRMLQEQFRRLRAKAHDKAQDKAQAKAKAEIQAELHESPGPPADDAPR